MHWGQRSRLVNAWHEATHWAWKSVPHNTREQWKDVPARVTMSIPFPVQRRRDPSNYLVVCKAVIDQLVKEGLWPDDTAEFVTVMEPLLTSGKSAWILLEER
jgi:Holliday junction resolvase RusA-like endonuclease